MRPGTAVFPPRIPFVSVKAQDERMTHNSAGQRLLNDLLIGALQHMLILEPLAKTLTMQYSKAVVFVAVGVFTSAVLK